MFITFEGLDGSGKTTQIELLRATLEREGHEVVATREPGGTALGERVRELVLHGGAMTPWAEAALFTAARAELVERVIRPALARGAVVLCDRYIDSSLAYQGIARRLGVDTILDVNLRATSGILPDLTFVLLVDPAVAGTRSAGDPDRIERESESFRARVHDAYRQLGDIFPNRIVLIDAAGTPDGVATEVHDALRRAS